MSVTANLIDGAIVQLDGRLQPIAEREATVLDSVRLPDDGSVMPVALAMTGGRQISAARRPAGVD